MNKSCLLVLLLGSTSLLGYISSGCKGNKPEVTDTIRTDTVFEDTVTTDSLESIIDEQPVPKAADELFDDFVFNFASSRRMQLSRIAFPLSVYEGDSIVSSVSKDKWKMERLFMPQGYYTLIFDNREQMALVKDTTISSVVVEKISLDNQKIKKFIFNRIRGKWMLTGIGNDVVRNSTNASFLKFYHHFASDSLYQIESMADEVSFTAPDPDDDFSTITGTITAEQWQNFKPEFIPSGDIYNILYGQKYTASQKKIFVIRGISNGFETEMIFSKSDDKWKLIKFSI